MATAVLPAPLGLPLDGGIIMAPSPVSPNTPRHGRSRAGSRAGKAGRARGYSTVEARETIISKALSFVFKRTVTQDEKSEHNDGNVVHLVTDTEGWIGAENVLAHPNMSALQVTFPELLGVIASAKSRVSIKASPDAEDTEIDMEPKASDYLIRQNAPIQKEPGSPTTGANAPVLTPFSEVSEDLPELIVHETSYANYPLVLAFGGIKRAGGQSHLSFHPITISEDGTETRAKPSTADVSIYLNLRQVMAANPSIQWAKNERGDVVTPGDADGVIPKGFWTKVVARRADIGVLFEDGVVKKEVPLGLRGKGAKLKKGKGKNARTGLKEMKEASSGEESSE